MQCIENARSAILNRYKVKKYRVRKLNENLIRLISILKYLKNK